MQGKFTLYFLFLQCLKKNTLQPADTLYRRVIVLQGVVDKIYYEYEIEIVLVLYITDVLRFNTAFKLN